MTELRNYLDKKCVWGYMTLCNECLDFAPSHVDIGCEVTDPSLPKVQCELCGAKPND